MVSLGGFSYDVEVNTSKGIANLDALVRRATTAKAELDRALSGSNPTISTSAAQQALGAVTTKAQQAHQAASFTATPKVDTKPAESALQKFGASVAQGIGFGGGAALAVKGIDALKAGLESSIGAGLKYNAQLETATRTLELFTGSSDKAQEALKILRNYADFTPFNTDEVIRGGQAFIGVVNGDIAAMEKLVRLTGQLAATNPDVSAGGGFEGATRALREVLGGQTTSIADRFNIPLSTIQSLKDAGLSGIDLAEALVKAAHGSEELVTALSETSTGKLSNFQSALANLGKTATEPLFEELGKSLDALNAGLTANKSGWDTWAQEVGRAIAYPIRQINTLAAGIAWISDHLPGAGVTPQAGAGQFGLFGSTSGSTRPATSPPAPGSIANPGTGPATAPSTIAPVRSAEQLKADAEKLGKELKEIDDDATRHALQNLDDHIKAVRREAAERKSAYEDARDAAVKAADATRDANIRALDDEAHARDRARTLEDRARAASQEAELRGLEAAHNANLKGLEEQATAIQKRHDEAVKGLDAEIRAVDQKRDAALRAIDDEERAESRRHSEALRNIDAERDRRLGIIDQQLRALDAAALRDQRRQTDQSLQRALADAQRERRQADTPEERQRADRAVADARAAIQREAVNRQREDARAALRDQADQIRAAADAARQIEDARNKTTSEGLSAQQRAINDQAQADTQRLQAIKARVDEETKIEADSIKARIDAENIGYQQTVQAARDAFEQINNAVADQRANEDAGLASRRRSVQDTYDAAVDAARAAADQQIKDLERQTNATTDNLDAQKRKWTEWKEHIQGEIDAAIKAGSAEALKKLQNLSITPPELQNAGAGPGEPPSRDEAAANLTAAAKRVASDVAAGLAAGISSPESVAAATAATDKLIQDGVIDEAKQLLGISSPSTVFSGFGSDTAQGFLDGYQAFDLAAPIRLPFEQSIDWLAGLPPVFQASGTNTAAAWQGAYQQFDLFAVGRLPFEQLNTWMTPGLENLMRGAGAADAAAFGTGWTSRNPGSMIQNDLQTIINNANNLQSQWSIVGQNFAVNLANGFNNYLNENPLYAPTGSGTTAVQGSTSSSTMTSTSSSGSTLRAGQYDVENYLLKYGLVPGTDLFNQYFDYYFSEQALGHSMPADMVITGHALGGFAQAGRMAWFGEQGPELGMPAQAGSILPADVSRNLLAVASGQAVGGGGTSVQIGSMTIQVPAGTEDPRGFAQQMMTEFAQLISSANVSTRPGAPSSLIGA